MKFPPRTTVAAAASIVILSGLPAHAGITPWRTDLFFMSLPGTEVPGYSQLPLRGKDRPNHLENGRGAVKSFLTGEEDDHHSGSLKHSGKHRVSSRHKSRSHPANQDDQDENSTKADSGSAHSKRPRATPTPEPESRPSPSPQARTSAIAGESAGGEPGAAPVPAQVSSLRPEALREYASQPPKVQELIRESLALTEKNLAYTYGSDDPANGGMDCSGFIYYVLQRVGFHDVPRDASEQYLWVRKHSDFQAVLSRRQDTFELNELRPGDLLFWSGTYGVNRDVPVTHVMIYLGKDKKSGKRLMVGASDGRTYGGVQRYGVSVFDFTLPNGQPLKSDPGRTPRFDGYATIPGLRPSNLARNTQPETQTSPPASTPTPTPTPSPSPARHRRARSHHGD